MKQLILDHRQSYMHLDIVYDMNKLIEKAKQYSIVYSSNRDVINHLVKIKKYEDKRKSNKKKRYGYILKVLLPKGNMKDDTAKLQSITKRLCKSVFHQEKLFYFSYLTNTFHDVWYLNIYISDREYHSFYKEYYKRNYYRNKLTGLMTSKDDENAELIHKKGDFKQYIKDSFASCKSTIFTGTKARFEKLMDDLKQLYVSILEKLQYVFQTNYIFKHKKYSCNTHRFEKRILSKLNILMYKMEYQIDRMINLNTRYLSTYEIHKEGLTQGYTSTRFIDEIERLFYKFNNRFNNMKFHIDKERFQLQTRVDLAEANILLLEQEFYKDIEKITEGKDDL